MTIQSINLRASGHPLAPADHTGCRNTGIHHVGLHAKDLSASAEFYRDLLGMQIVGGSGPEHPLGACAFLCSRPDEESHEIVLFANPDNAHVAFKVSSLAELRAFYTRVVEKGIPIKFAFNHGVSFSFYFDDPDGHIIEVYWPTAAPQSYRPGATGSDAARRVAFRESGSRTGQPQIGASLGHLMTIRRCQ